MFRYIHLWDIIKRLQFSANEFFIWCVYVSAKIKEKMLFECKYLFFLNQESFFR